MSRPPERDTARRKHVLPKTICRSPDCAEPRLGHFHFGIASQSFRRRSVHQHHLLSTQTGHDCLAVHEYNSCVTLRQHHRRIRDCPSGKTRKRFYSDHTPSLPVFEHLADNKAPEEPLPDPTDLPALDAIVDNKVTWLSERYSAK